MTLKAGDSAPEIELPDQDGHLVRLADLRGRNVVIFFYPRDNTPVCTKESCAFRDAYADFEAANAEVFGVSADDAQSHAGFASKHSLPFKLLSDQDRAAARAFGVPQRLGLMPARMTFVIDQQGIVRHVTHSEFSAERHTQEALQALSRM